MTKDELTALLESKRADAVTVKSTAKVADVLRMVIAHVGELEENGTEKPKEASGMLSITAAAQQLGLSRSWMYQHAGDLSFVVKYPNGTLRCDSKKLDVWKNKAATS